MADARREPDELEERALRIRIENEREQTALEAAKPRPDARPARRFWVRAGAGLLGIVLAGATVWAVETAPLPGVSTAPAGHVLTPEPGDQQRVCPGPLTLLGQSSADPTAASYKGYAEIATAGSAVDDLEITGVQPDFVENPAEAAPGSDATGVPAYFQGPGEIDGTATSLSVSQSATVSSPGAGGFAATACAQASADQWLVGGASTEGSSTVLSLVNPTSAGAVVRVDLHGIEGALPTAGLDGIEVPPNTQLAVSLEGVAPNEEAFVAHVTTRGTVIGASLHEVGLEGIDAQGVEIIGPSPQPALRLDFVGVPFPGTSNEEDESVFAKRGATLRLFTIGDEAADVTITLRDETGEALEPLTMTLVPGVVADVPLGAYPVGRYSVTVDADRPVVGGLRTSLVNAPYDFGWYQPSEPLDGSTQVSIAPGPSPRLHLATIADIPVSVTVTGRDGDAQRITLQPGTTTSIDAPAGAYRIDGMLGVVAAVTYDGPGQMSGVPVVAGNPLADDITVYR